MKGEGDIYEDDLYLTKSMNLCKSLFGIGIAMNISVVRLTGTLSFISWGTGAQYWREGGGAEPIFYWENFEI